MRHSEFHRAYRMGWLPTAVLGDNDGIVSTASLVIGVAAARVDFQAIMVCAAQPDWWPVPSMAAGEYVSVSSQVDIFSRVSRTRELI